MFFFQAEDGIRDHCVTGVQTCALPISRTGCRRRRRACSAWATEAARGRAPKQSHETKTRIGHLISGIIGPRSEERRVGKSVDLGGRRIIKKNTEESEGSFNQKNSANRE